MGKEPKVFLIQISGERCERDPEGEYYTGAKRWVDEIFEHNKYINEGWTESTKDQDFGKAEAGDIVLVYCTSSVEECPKQIRYIYRVLDKPRRHELGMKLLVKLRRRLGLTTIKSMVRDGKLSQKMKNCGRQGFNICQVEYSDYEAIINWDKEQEEIPVEPYEDELRSYFVERPLAKILGDDYRDFELFEDEKGISGELYQTDVGQIDLLYRNNKSGNFLVIELKKTRETPDTVVGQIARYMGWVGENLAKGNKVHGLIVVHDYSEELRYAIQALKNCKLKLATFGVRFDVKLV
jgi:hypothetical protein